MTSNFKEIHGLDFSNLNLYDLVRPHIAEDIGQLDIRVGKIMQCRVLNVNPKLLIESVHVGEREPREASSELARRYSPDQLMGRRVVVLCNANPVERRGIDRRAMLLCAEKGDDIELLDPPPDAEVGDYVVVDGFPRRPLQVALSAEIMARYEKSPFERVNAELKVNHLGQAVFRDQPLRLEKRQGSISTTTLTAGGIRFQPLRVEKKQGFISAGTLKDCGIKFE